MSRLNRSGNNLLTQLVLRGVAALCHIPECSQDGGSNYRTGSQHQANADLISSALIHPMSTSLRSSATAPTLCPGVGRARWRTTEFARSTRCSQWSAGGANAQNEGWLVRFGLYRRHSDQWQQVKLLPPKPYYSTT